MPLASADSTDSAERRRQWFLTTQWNIVLSTGDANAAKADAAREKLCGTYWPPLYNFVCRQGYSIEDAKDLTQAFFAKLVEKDFWTRADPKKGRFRSLLLTALRQFLSDQRERGQTAKRGGGAILASLDESGVEEQFLGATASDQQFDRQWANAILDHAREKLRQECMASGKLNFFEQINLLGEKQDVPVTYAEMAAELGQSVSAVKSAVARLRQRYGELVREEVAQTVADPAEVDSEIAYLLSVIAS